LFTGLTAFGVFLLPWRRLKTSKTQEVLVKFSATILLSVLMWLAINSLGELNDNHLWILMIALPVFTGVFFLNRLRSHRDPNQMNPLTKKQTKIVNRLNITKI